MTDQAPPDPTYSETGPPDEEEDDVVEDIGDPDVLPPSTATDDKARIAELEEQLKASRHSVKDLNSRICELEVALLEVEKTLEAISSTPPPPAGGPAPPGFASSEDGGPPPAPGDDSGGPPPPPPAPGGGPPPPTGGAKVVKLPDNRGALLASIEGFKKGGLKKGKMKDSSAPVTTTPKPSGPPSIAAMAAGQLKNLKKLDGKRTASGRMSRERAAQNRAQVAVFTNLKKASGPAASTAGSAAQTPAQPAGVQVNLRKTDNAAKPAGGAGGAGAGAGQANQVNFKANLKTTGGGETGGAQKTKSGRMVTPKAATGPPPKKIDYREALKKSGGT